MRLIETVPAASVGPVEPAETSASARPSPTAAAAWTIEASLRERTAATGSSPALIVSGASISSARSPALSSSSFGPKSRTGSRDRRTPSATAPGPWSAPFASTAITAPRPSRLLVVGRRARLLHDHLAARVGAAVGADPVRHARRVAAWAIAQAGRGDLVL